MSLLLISKEAFERVKRYLTVNQYCFKWKESHGQWIVTIKY